MSADENADIASKAVAGSIYSVAASAVTIVLGFVRSVLLARLLLPEHFGVVTLVLFYLNLSTQIRGFGLDNALIQRKDADDKVLATYFTLRQGLIFASLAILLAFIPLIRRLYPDIPLLMPVLLAFMAISLVKGFNAIQVTILNKHLAFRHLALVNILSSISMTIVAPTMAWLGWGVWSLVAERFTGVFVNAIVIWIFYRPWRPRFGWDTAIAKQMFVFGSKLWIGGNISFLLDRFDDFWVGTILGKIRLGYYSQAYQFANYPRHVVADPIVSVFFPTFARLQDDPLRLSRAFFRTMSLMVRTGFWFSLVFIFTAPEFILIFLEAKWMPMLATFQIMIVYTIFDPLVSGLNSLLIAVGQPQMIVKARSIQLVIFLPSVILLATLFDIEGVAVAADLMLFIGAILLLWYCNRFVHYSHRTLWLWPTVALIVTTTIIVLLQPIWENYLVWVSFIGKIAIISIIYWGLLWITERDQLQTGWRMVWGLIAPRLKRR